ncbi:hypothetical protein AGMMS49579_12410 [Spirochaetia bacterium]|nr:hypothetical protein AGMMS49579_12410 [Spirochaetia bacterium]
MVNPRLCRGFTNFNYNGELITFLQTALGWGITGDTSEQVMFILVGNGANGKSTPSPL